MNPYHPYNTWAELVDSDPKKWYSLYKTCILEEIEDLNKRAKTKKNIATRKGFEEMLAETNQILTNLGVKV